MAKAIKQEMATPSIRRDGRVCEHTGRARELAGHNGRRPYTRKWRAAQGDMWRSSSCATEYTTERASS